MNALLVPVTSCAVCGSSGAELVLEQPEGLMPGGLLSLYRCKSCSLVYLNPRLSNDGIEALENRSTVYEYTHEHVQGEIGKLEKMVRWLEVLAERPPERGRLLDVGCNRGMLLAAARRLGWTVTGVELSGVAAERARRDFDVEVYYSLKETRHRGPFDLITGWHILEHTTDPLAFVQDLSDLLAPGGAIAFQVPSFEFLCEFKTRSMITSLICAVHNFYFTTSSAARTIERAGLLARHIINDPKSLTLTLICMQFDNLEARNFR